MSITVAQANLDRGPGGTPFSREFGDIYHPASGGLAQARHVFLAGNGLPGRWAGRDHFVILETGFGLGLNFLATWAAWRADPHRPRRLHFVSIESRPVPGSALAAALDPFDELAPLARELVDAWPPPLAGHHRIPFDAGRVMLTLVLGEADPELAAIRARADALYLDGFAPARNPGMWSPEIVRSLAALAAPGSTLATWTVAGGVRALLADAGFHVEKRPGFGSKREMLAGWRDGEPGPAPAGRQALVVGGGLAGSLVAERLAARDWDVCVIEAMPGRDRARVGLVRPIANLRDALNARLSRAAFLYALRHFRALAGEGGALEWNPCGILQLAGDDDEAARFEAIAGSLGYPPEFLEFVDAARARSICGHAVSRGGWWFPGGAVLSPAGLAQASRERGGERIRWLAGRVVDRLEREGASWRALDADSRVVAEAPALILANAADAARLLPEARLRLSAVRGQVTYLPPDEARALRVVVSGNGYVAPLPGGGHCVGASYHHDDADPAVRASEQRDNLARAESLLPGFTRGLEAATLDGWTGWRTTVPDRLPIFGAATEAGVHAATGLGSRGLLWAPLGAELLACQLEGEPLPLPAGLAGAVSPRRFLS